VHGDSRVDNYFLAAREVESEGVAYLHAEDALRERGDATARGVAGRALRRDGRHIKEDDDSAPYRRGEFFYFTRTAKGAAVPDVSSQEGIADRARGSAARSERDGRRARRS
jgi:oligopeptidase B